MRAALDTNILAYAKAGMEPQEEGSAGSGEQAGAAAAEGNGLEDLPLARSIGNASRRAPGLELFLAFCWPPRAENYRWVAALG